MVSSIWRADQDTAARPCDRSSAGRVPGRGNLATRLGVGLREARRTAGLDAARACGAAALSRSHASARSSAGTERGASIETWACLAAAVGEQLVAFLEHAPGADRPRDIEHLRRQSALDRDRRRRGLVRAPRARDRPGVGPVALASTSRSSAARPREAVVVEVWDWFDDVGAGLRGLDAKVGVLATRLASQSSGRAEPGGSAACTSCAAPDGTGASSTSSARSSPPVSRVRRWPGSGRLRDAVRAMPAADGLLWSDASGSLTAGRLGRR